MKIAIIGAGFSSCSIGLDLSKKHEVDLYEKESIILSSSSAYNQMRFHSGYHYPRSQKTFNEIQKSKKSFLKFYRQNMFGNTNNYYNIPILKSKTSTIKYKKFLDKNKLFYKKVDNDNFFNKKIHSSFLVKEQILNYLKLKKQVAKKIIRFMFNKKNLNSSIYEI